MQKIILLSSTFLLISFMVKAQLHLEIGINTNRSTMEFGQTYDLGAGMYLEPKYAVSKNIDVGVSLGVNAFVGFGKNNNSNDDLDTTWLLSVLPSGTYRFKQGKISPYLGLSVGIYFAEPVQFEKASFDGGKSTNFGFAPRFGIYLGRFNLGAVYNKAGDISFFQFNLGVRLFSRN